MAHRDRPPSSPVPGPPAGSAPGELFEGRFGDRIETLSRLTGAWRARPWASTGAGLLAVAVMAVGWWLGRPSSAGPVEDRIPFAPGVVSTAAAPGPAEATTAPGVGGPPGPGTAAATGSGPSSTEEVPAELIVHVAGAVARPGIVRLDPGARVIDAVEAAGGPTAEADVDQLNLAAPVSDGLQIRVPRQGETLTWPTGVAPAGPGPPSAPGGSSAAPVNLNLASPAELEQLPGIGPSLAAAIVTWRQEQGPFLAVEDLLDVPGIGPAKLTALADHVIV